MRMPLSGLFWLWDGVVVSAYCVLMGCSSCPPGGNSGRLVCHGMQAWFGSRTPTLLGKSHPHDPKVCASCAEKRNVGLLGSLHRPTIGWNALAWSHLPVMSSDLADLLEHVSCAMCRTYAGLRGDSFSRFEFSFWRKCPVKVAWLIS